MLVKNNHNDIILQSHERCIKYEISKNIKKPLNILDFKDISNKLDENKVLIKIAKQFMKILYDFLKGSGFSIYLTDKDGIVLTIIGDKEIVDKQAEVGIDVGTDMSEESAGTNAIGLGLHDNCSVQLAGEEHFIEIFHIWTCSAAIIHNENCEIIGCLNLTGRRQLVHSHTLGLVVAAAKSIENQLGIEKIQKELSKTNRYLSTIMDSINLGILTTDTNGIIIGANDSLCSMLFKNKEKLISKNINNLLGNWGRIIEELTRGNTYENKDIVLNGVGKKNRYDISVYPIRNQNNEMTGTVVVFNDIQNVYNLVNKYTGMSAVYTFEDIIGESKALMKIKNQARNISNSPSTVLIQGESGTGKELIAQSIHNNSNRRNKSFVAINCGALPKGLVESELFGYEEGAFTGAKRGGHAGKFELANRGTLFLDEIGEMPLDMQVSLLRVLQEGCVTRLGGNKCSITDVRIIASTNKDLKKEVDNGTFREDLYYRLSVIPIYMPPLRDRSEDVEVLIKYFLRMKSFKLGKPIPKIKDDIYEKMLKYSWPGNVREMENCIENIVNMGGNTSFKFENQTNEKKEDNMRNELNYNMCSLKEWEKKAIINCLDNCNGNISRAAKILGINRTTLHSKINEYGKVGK